MPHITWLLNAAQAANPALTGELAAVWTSFVEEMNEHLWKEEIILFPLVRAMTAGTRGTASHCGGKQNPIRVMLMEHDAADRALVALRQLTGGYQAGAELTALDKALEELDTDLQTHMHKENEILFPCIVALQ